MALKQQRPRVEGALDSPPRVPVGWVFEDFHDILGLRGGLGPWWSVWGPGGREESREGSGGPREVLGDPRGALGYLHFLCFRCEVVKVRMTYRYFRMGALLRSGRWPKDYATVYCFSKLVFL